MGYSRQEYWSGLPFPSPGDLPNPGIEPGSPALISLCKNIFPRKAGLYYEECSGHISNGLFSPPLPEIWGDFPFGSSWWESCKVSGSRIHKVRLSFSLRFQGDFHIHWIPSSLSDCQCCCLGVPTSLWLQQPLLQLKWPQLWFFIFACFSGFQCECLFCNFYSLTCSRKIIGFQFVQLFSCCKMVMIISRPSHFKGGVPCLYIFC